MKHLKAILPHLPLVAGFIFGGLVVVALFAFRTLPLWLILLVAAMALMLNGGNCGRRVLRGGSWLGTPDFLRSAVRDSNAPDNRSFIIGFRLFCSPPSDR